MGQQCTVCRGFVSLAAPKRWARIPVIYTYIDVVCQLVTSSKKGRSGIPGIHLWHSPYGKSRLPFCYILNKTVKKTKNKRKNMFMTWVYILVIPSNNLLSLLIPLLFVIPCWCLGSIRQALWWVLESAGGNAKNAPASHYSTKMKFYNLERWNLEYLIYIHT